jgi:cytochrome c biogenesis protein CcmG, thiol:disulfide interchange protein DsbE
VFLGVNSNDNRGDAEKFLKQEPVPYKHFEDPKLEIAAVFNAVQAFPSTAFYDSKGELAFVHQGGYSNEDALSEDIDRYAR